MATVRTLPIALLLTLCFAACVCACTAAGRKPTNRYISYAPVPHARGGNDGVPPGCSAITKCAGRQPPSIRGRRPPKAGATTAAAAVSQSQGLAALQTASTKGGAKALAAGPKVDYITKP